MATKILVCLVLVVAAVSAGPPNIRRAGFYYGSDMSGYQCARQCRETPTKFRYRSGMTYVYDYKAELETSMVGASEDKAKMLIEARANIEVISTCEFALRLENVKLYHLDLNTGSLKLSEKSPEFEQAFTANTLRFSFDDGVIQDICHSSQEKIWVLNFKRGILSVFQNSMDDFSLDNQKLEEIDVTGECQVQYNKTSKWAWDRSITIQKSKDKKTCSNHHSLNTFIPVVPYKIPSGIQALPIIKSTQECHQVISSSKLIQSVTCEESHIYAPFSNHQSGGATVSTQTLIYKTMIGSVQTDEDYVESRSSLVYHHMNGRQEFQDSMFTAQQKLKELCEQTKDSMRAATPSLFGELVQSVKGLSAAELRSLLKMIHKKKVCANNRKAKKFLLDTLPIAGTEGALETIVRVLNSDSLPEMEKRVWLASVSLISEPSKEMLPSILKLLSGPYAEQSLLPASALLNTLCKKNADLEKSYQFRKIVDKINENIDSTCSPSKQQTMRTLRAIGNIGFGQKFLRTLRTCLQSGDAPLEHKLAAADAYRKFQCQENEENGPLAQVFETPEADSELRMLSFLSLMRCPSQSVLERVVAQLDKETDFDVGGFVYSHLKNLMETSDPHKQELAEVIKGLTLRHFSDVGLKSSRCYESSLLLNRLNLGYVADADLFWSSPAAVPRGARVNLTMELFGNSINVFDAGAHVDGFEYLVQKYFGKEGYFAEAKSGRDDLKAFFYSRMFGNEFFFHQINGVKDIEESLNMKSYLTLDKILDNLSKDFNYKYSHSQQLFDGSLIVPTLVGLPINVTVNSSLSVNAEAKGKIDLGGILSRSKDITINADIDASGALEVTGTMLLDAHLCNQGLRMRNTLHSSVTFKPSIKISRRQILDIEVEAPKQKQELFDARSEFFIIHENVEKQQEMIKENRKEMKYCTGDTFGDVSGLELCAELQYPNASMKADAPYFPLTGPVRASVVLDRKDSQRNYKIFAKWIRKSKKVEAQVILDTPGSRINRQISAEVAYNGVSKGINNVDVVLISPWLKFVVNGKSVMGKEQNSLTGNVVVDDTKRYALTAAVQRKKKEKYHEYTPVIEIENLDRKITLLSGSVIHNENKDISSSLRMIDWNEKSYSLESKLVYARWEKRILLAFGLTSARRPYKMELGGSVKSSGTKKLRFEGVMTVQTPKRTIVSLTSKAEHQANPLKGSAYLKFKTFWMKMPFVLKANLKPSSIQRKQKKYELTAKLSSPFGTAESTVTTTLLRNKQIFSTSLTYDVASMEDKINWNVKLINKGQNKLIQYEIYSLMISKKMPQYNSEGTLKISHKTSSLSNPIKFVSSMKLDAKYGEKYQSKNTKKVINLDALVKGELKKFITQAQINARLKAKIPDEKVDFAMTVSHNHNKRKLDSEINLQLLPFVENDIKASLFLNNKGNSMANVIAEGRLDANGEQFRVYSQLVQKTKQRFEHSLTAEAYNAKHRMTTIYKNSKNQHDISIDVIESFVLSKPIKVRMISTGKSFSNLQLKGFMTERKTNKQVHYIFASSKLDKTRFGKWRFILDSNKRNYHVKAQANFNRNDLRIESDASVNWDAMSKQKPLSEIRVSSLFKPGSEEKSEPMKSTLDVTAPFKSFRKFFFLIEKSKTELTSSGRINMGGSKQLISSKLTAQLPISIDSAKLTFEAKTPFKKYKEIEIDVDHSLNRATKLEGKVNRGASLLSLTGEHKGIDSTKTFEGKALLRADHITGREIVLTSKLSSNEEEMGTYLSMEYDGEKYIADFDIKNTDSEKGSGVLLSGPNRVARSSLKYLVDNGKHQLTATLDHSEQGKKNLAIKAHGIYQDLNNLQLNGDARYGRRLSRRMKFEFLHENTDESLKNKLILSKGRAKTGYDVKLTYDPMSKSGDIVLFLSPAYENDVTLTTNVDYSVYPVTASTQISWAPSSRVYLGGSYKAETQDDVVINLKLTTPFENFENIAIGASNKLKSSIRVHHFNIDYAIGKMIDVELRTQNDEDEKLARIKISSPDVILHELDCGVKFDMKKEVYQGDFIVIVSPEHKYTGDINLRSKDDKLNGRIDVQTPIEGYKEIECKLNQKGSGDDKTHTFTLRKEDVSLADITVETTSTDDEVTVKATTKGKLVKLVADASEELSRLSLRFLPRIKKISFGNEIEELEVELKMKQSGKMQQLDGSITADYIKKHDRHSFYIRKIGDELNDIEVEIGINDNDFTSKGTFVFKNTDDIRFEFILTGHYQEEWGVRFSHKENLGQFETKGGIILLDGFVNKFDLVMTDINHIELSIVSDPLRRRHKTRTLKYKHVAQDDQMSCEFSFGDSEQSFISLEISAQCSPGHHISINVKTPFEDFNKILVQGSYTKRQISGFVQVKEKKMIDLSGQYDKFQNLKLTLVTPEKLLQSLTIETNGKLSDGSSNFVLSFNDDDQIDGSLTVKYQDLSQMNFDAALNMHVGKLDNNLQWQMETIDSPRKPFHFLLAMNDNQIKLDTEQQEQYNGDLRHIVDLKLNYPILSLKSNSLVLSTDGNMNAFDGDLRLLADAGKLLDATISYDMMNSKKGTILVREPKQMEYTFTQQNYADSDENELVFNWDRVDPDANLVIKTVVRDVSTSLKIDRSVKFTLQCPKRTFGLEHSIIAESTSLDTSAKILWDNLPDSQLGYHLIVNDLSNRREDSYDGDLRIQLPTRAVGIHGATSYNLKNGRHVESTLRWDLDRDDSKKIGVKANLLRQDHTQATVSLILPQDSEIASKLIINKGNTVLEGETKISYSDNSRETLTLFSKVENNQEYSFFSSEERYNYSIQFGLNHPESRLDVKMNSHLGVDKERLTSSLGIDYLTSRRQQTNFALFGEINKLRREINLYSTSPFKSVGFTGSIISQDPLEIVSKTTIDDEERMTTHLLVDPTNKKLTIDSTNYGEGLRFTAYYPNETALKINIDRNADSFTQQENGMVIQLVSPNVLQTTFDWTPGTLVAVRDMVYEQFKQGTMETKEFVDDVAVNLKKEFISKYRSFVESISDIGESKISFIQQEVVSLDQELEELKSKLQSSTEFCELRIGDFVLNEELGKLKEQLISFVLELDSLIQPYIDAYRTSLLSVSEKLIEIKDYPIEEAYQTFVNQIGRIERKVFKTDFWGFSKALHSVELEWFEKLWNFTDEIVEKFLNPQPLIDHIHEQIKDAMNSRISLYLINVVKDNSWLASNIQSALIQLREDISNHPIMLEIVATAEDSVNGIYQQAKWAFDYWELEKTIPKHVDELMKLMTEVIEQEIREGEVSLLGIIQNPITRTDLENGLLEARFVLPISLKRLDQAPSHKEISENVSRYLDMDKSGILKGLYKGVKKDDMLEDFENFQPYRRSYNSLL